MAPATVTIQNSVSKVLDRRQKCNVGCGLAILASLKDTDVDEILNLFKKEIDLLIQMYKLEKMKISKKIPHAVLPFLAMDIQQPPIFMDIIEQNHPTSLIYKYKFGKKWAKS